MISRRALLLAAVLALAGAAGGGASESGLTGGEGHPRARFPLAVHAGSLGEPALDAAVRRAIDDWNALFVEALGVAAFAPAARPEDAQVTVAFERRAAERLMGETRLAADGEGRLALPVRIVVFEPAARGQTVREVVLYQVVAHELGHALGLPHARDPRSLMCCDRGALDFADAAVREAYVEARRHPDVRSVRAQVLAHYRAFWQRR